MAMKIVQQDERAILSGHKDFPMFSVIMPIYNGERYLEQAIISVMTQTEDAWELILINDGSIDSSSDICRKYAAMDSRILLIEKEKSGVSDSRNKGLDIAKGEWIVFLDADDWFEINLLYEFKKRIVQSSFDFYVCNYFDVFGEKEKKCARGYTIDRIEKILFSELAEMSLRQSQWKNKVWYGGFRSVWAKCFKREYINKNNLRFFPQLKIGEDMIFVLEYMKYIENVEFINGPLYNYRDNPISVMHKRVWGGNEEGKLYFSKAEEIVGNIVGEGAKADLWLETAEYDWKVLTISNTCFLQKITILRELMQDELYVRFSKKDTYKYSSKKQMIYAALIRRKAALSLMMLNYCYLKKKSIKRWIDKAQCNVHNI